MVRPADYIHPEDEAARRNMEAIPGFATAMKLLCVIMTSRLCTV